MYTKVRNISSRCHLFKLVYNKRTVTNDYDIKMCANNYSVHEVAVRFVPNILRIRCDRKHDFALSGITVTHDVFVSR